MGRGMCEGWSLEIGEAFRGSVVRSQTLGMPVTWLAMINATALDEYLEREIAMRQVEAQIERCTIGSCIWWARGSRSPDAERNFNLALFGAKNWRPFSMREIGRRNLPAQP